MVWDKLITRFRNPEDVKRELQEKVKDGQAELLLKFKLKQVEEELALGEDEKSQLTQQWAKRRIKDDVYEAIIGRVEDKEMSLTKQKKELEQKLMSVQQIDLDTSQQSSRSLLVRVPNGRTGSCSQRLRSSKTKPWVTFRSVNSMMAVNTLQLTQTLPLEGTFGKSVSG